MAGGGGREDILKDMELTLLMLRGTDPLVLPVPGRPDFEANTTVGFVTRDPEPIDNYNATQFPLVFLLGSSMEPEPDNREYSTYHLNFQVEVMIHVRQKQNRSTRLNMLIEDIVDIMQVHPQRNQGTDQSSVHDTKLLGVPDVDELTLAPQNTVFAHIVFVVNYRTDIDSV